MRCAFLNRLVVISIVLFSLACQKDADGENESGYFMKIKKNGSWVNYTQVAGEYGPDLLDPTKTNLLVIGSSNDQNETFDLNIQVDGNNVPTGTYSSDNTNYYVLVTYVTGYIGGNDIVHFENSNAPGREPSKYFINITSITETDISGTFTGNYLHSLIGNGSAEDLVSVTEGSFKVKRIR